MEQRSLRLGDIVDDYCPRERRITNHTIVALIGDTIRQTRCATCEAEHGYKEARLPIKKVKTGSTDSGSHLSGGVLVSARTAVGGQAPEPIEGELPQTNGAAASESPSSEEAAQAPIELPSADEPPREGWLANRPLIRATLPKVEGELPPLRVIPEFTMHQRQGRGFAGRGFRPGPSGSGGNGNGAPFREGNGPNGNRPSHAGKPGRHRRRPRRPR